MADEGLALGPKAVAQLKKLFHDFYGEVKNPGGQPKRGNISIGLSSYVVKIKTTIQARSGGNLGEGEVYLCETDNEGTATATTIVKTAYNVEATAIPLSTDPDKNYTRMHQTNWGVFVVQAPGTTRNVCSNFDGLSSSDISGWSSDQAQFLRHTSDGCLHWITPTTCPAST